MSLANGFEVFIYWSVHIVNKQNGYWTIEHVFSEVVCHVCMAGVLDLNSNYLGVNATTKVRQFDEDLYAIIL